MRATQPIRDKANSWRFSVTQYPDLELYVGGQWKKAPGQPVLNPADESVLGTVPSAT
jgi:hypothetical protein